MANPFSKLPQILRSSAAPGRDDMFLFLLGTRWLALLPALLALNVRAQPTWSVILFGMAVLSTLLLTVLYPRLNRWLRRYPALLLLDMAFMAVILSQSGGTASPYLFFTISPLLAAAFFFQIRGGLIASTLFTPLYLIAIATAAQQNPKNFSVVAATEHLVVIYSVAVIMGYPSILLRRLRNANSELHHAQEELSRAQTLAAVGGMVAHVSHEIRNPLTTLGGYARQLKRKPDDAEKVRHHAQIIADEVLRLEELLNDMLDLSRPRRAEQHPASLHDLLDRACALAGDWETTQIEVKKQYDPHLPPVNVDAPALLRAWINILRNAMQAMPGGGTLTITTRCEADGAKVSISDTGCGIAPEILPNIWKPFVTHRERGTGLGLAVTQQIIREHGGMAGVESTVGRGTTFHFTLPASCRQEPAEEEIESEAAGAPENAVSG
jgi:signal transduction histidine kinase